MRQSGVDGRWSATSIERLSMEPLAPLQLALTLSAALALDGCWGEWSRFHPLVGFGRMAQWSEQRFNTGTGYGRLIRGMILTLLLIGIPVSVVTELTLNYPRLAPCLDVLCLYWAIGWRSLGEHIRPIASALAVQDLPLARFFTARIVSRDVTQATAPALACAAVESTLENANDAIFAALFWFMLGGAPAVVLFRCSNTLDAMWGYRTDRFFWFGKFAARLDDGLNVIPARLTAWTYVLLGSFPKRAWQCWQQQAPHWDSPNAGVVMSSGAGALGVRLGGEAVYHGQREMRPILGTGAPPSAVDVERAWRLLSRGVWLWLLSVWAVALVGVGIHVWGG